MLIFCLIPLEKYEPLFLSLSSTMEHPSPGTCLTHKYKNLSSISSNNEAFLFSYFLSSFDLPCLSNYLKRPACICSEPVTEDGLGVKNFQNALRLIGKITE